MQLHPKQSITSTNTTQQAIVAPTISPSVYFNVYLGLGIPSFIVYIFIIIYVFSHKNLRSAPNNYCLLILLIVAFATRVIGLPFDLYYYYEGTALLKNAIFCGFWRILNYGGYAISAMLLAWASFERHILIFHDHLLRSKWANICLHYAPPFVIIIYVVAFYISALYFYPCRNLVNFQSFACGNDCMRNYPAALAYSKMAHQMSPSIFIAIFSISLFIRVLYSKRRFQQAFSWRKHSKMAYQLLSISFVCNAAVFPFGLLIFLNQIGIRDIPKSISDYSYFFSMLVPFYLPFIYITSLPDLWSRIKWRIRPTNLPQMVATNFTAKKR
ncbi:unnamed protein product [Rotaria sp. Silwood2]|nr:unnamed protein product [Rotaria sp. Silwood2]CAF4682804.1 unnamed protein product [Rotaria sp. Silwood2]